MPALPLHMCFAMKISEKYSGLAMYPLMVGAILPDCLYTGDSKSFRTIHCLRGSLFQADNIIRRFGDAVTHPEDMALMVGWHSHVWLDAYDRKRGLTLLGKKKIHESDQSRMRFYDDLCDYAREDMMKIIQTSEKVPTPMITVLEQTLDIALKNPQEQLKNVLSYIEHKEPADPERRPLVKREVFDRYLEEALDGYPYEELGLELSGTEVGETSKSTADVLDPAFKELDLLGKDLEAMFRKNPLE